MRVMLARPFSFNPYGDEACSAPLRVDISCPDADTLVLTPSGEADSCTAPGLRQALSEGIGAGRSRIIVDLDQLTFMDASTLGALVDARQRISAAGGDLQVRCRSRHRRRMLSITGLDGMSTTTRDVAGSLRLSERAHRRSGIHGEPDGLAGSPGQYTPAAGQAVDEDEPAPIQGIAIHRSCDGPLG